jgi:hypothetical protein
LGRFPITAVPKIKRICIVGLMDALGPAVGRYRAREEQMMSLSFRFNSFE